MNLMKKDGIKNITFLLIYAGIAIWVGILCFYHLGEAGTHNWDEARHIVNAYEMMKTDNMWIHTYQYETDYYNFKPPLSMWCIVAAFRLFGVNAFSMRVYSAICMFLLFLLLSLFVTKEFGRKAAVVTGIVFASGSDMFFFHMARSADADALYLLLFTGAMLCLYLSERKPWFLTGTGILLSLAFMAKSLHMAVGGVILICYLPRIWKKVQWKHLLTAIAGLGIPTGIWAVVRFCNDGFTFFMGMMQQEVTSRVIEGKDYLGYLRYVGQNMVILLFMAAAVLSLILASLSQKRDCGEKENQSLYRKIIGGGEETVSVCSLACDSSWGLQCFRCLFGVVCIHLLFSFLRYCRCTLWKSRESKRKIEMGSRDCGNLLACGIWS